MEIELHREPRLWLAVGALLGPAGALQWLAPKGSLPPVYSGHNTYYLWGPPNAAADVAIILGQDEDDLRAFADKVDLGGMHECQYCPPWRSPMPLWIVRGIRPPWARLWPSMKHFD